MPLLKKILKSKKIKKRESESEREDRDRRRERQRQIETGDLKGIFLPREFWMLEAQLSVGHLPFCPNG